MEGTKDKRIPKDSKVSKQTHIVEETTPAGGKQYNCTACRKTFRSRSQKYYHLNCNNLQELIYKCEHCDKSFARHSQWKYHVESHLSPINECPKCRKTFSNPLALKKHEALHNVEPKPCPHCDKTFQKKISLEQHIAAQHLNHLEFGCAFCNKKYASKSTLHLHLQSHQKKRFECSVCGKLFQRNSILNLHLKRHYHTNNYKCAVCQKVFSESGALSRHRKIHEENVLQYHCKLCNKNILRKDNMTRHLNTMHPEEKFEDIVDILCASIHQKNVEEPKNVEGNESDKEYFNEKQIENTSRSSNEKCVILENKIIQKPLQPISGVVDVSQNSEVLFTTTNDYVNPPIGYHTQVITPVPVNEKVHNLNYNDGTSRELLDYQTLEQRSPQEYITLTNFSEKEQTTPRIYNENLLQIPNTENYHVIENPLTPSIKNSTISQIYQEKSQNQTEKHNQECDSYKTTEIKHYFILNNNIINESEKSLRNSKNIVSNTITAISPQAIDPEAKEFINRQEFLNGMKEPAAKSDQITPPPITQTVTSVIKSVGNVKNNLPTTIVTVSNYPPTTSSTLNLEYKHKKYCRNNYDIDLYRKILGCDEDDNYEDYNNCSEIDNNHQQRNNEDEQSQNNVTATKSSKKNSSAPVHWRKSFKNNYETSAS